ncbi:unnamed protein product, partial [Angiostrongylus costaricensis]|uniref:C2H2-type domain-containing protein n=1 Tax=Angiostrongylus costaricensis TaxID=334426 RepID=A0A158PKV0_ANGCS
MHRAQPMFVEQKGNLSMYSNWHQVNINETESKLNLLYMGMCSTKPRTGVKPFWRYSVANRDHGQYKMTHSSFWEYRNKVKAFFHIILLISRISASLHDAYGVRLNVFRGDNQSTSKCKPPEDTIKTSKSTKRRDPVIGGYRTDEVYVYVRGRGRGRYVCERCGIRCKKPSMLNKHI